MDRDEAAAQLAGVSQTEERLAERAHWPFHRHAMFGLMEGLFVTGLSQPSRIGLPMMGVGFALFALCIYDDRRRHGMFVSGWQTGPTRPLTFMLLLFVAGMAALALIVRDGVSAQPMGYLIGVVTFAVSTACSLWWERIYRASLAPGSRS